MNEIGQFLSKVEAELLLARESGIYPPDPEQELSVLKRLSEKCPELGINPEEERKILLHARLSLNARNN